MLPKIEPFEAYPEKLDVTSEDLVALKTQQVTAQAELKRLTDEITNAQQELEKLVLDEGRLFLAERLKGLDQLRSRMQTSVQDLPMLRSSYNETLSDIKRIAHELGSNDEANPKRIVKTPTEIARLEQLKDEMARAITVKDTRAGEVNRLRELVRTAQEEHRSLLDNAPAQNGLIELFKRYDVDSLAPAAATAIQAIASSNETLQDALAVLSIGQLEFQDVPECPVEKTEADKLAEQHTNHTANVTRADETISQQEEDVAVKTAQIAKLEASIGVTNDENARQARLQRDTLWRKHRAALSPETADAFLPSMKHVDDIEEARLTHARELGELRQLEQTLVEAETRLEATKRRREGLQSQVEAIEDQVETLTTKIGLPILSPARFRDWVELRDIAAGAKRNQEKFARQHSKILDQADKLHEALLPLLPLETPSFETALAAARKLAEEEQAYNDKVDGALEKKVALEKELEGRLSDFAELSDAAEKALGNWAEKVHELFDGAVLPDMLTNAIGQLRDTRELDEKLQHATSQVSSMERDQHEFANAITALTEEFDVDESDHLKAFLTLEGIANQAQTDKLKHDELLKKIAASKEKRKTTEAQLDDIDLQVAEIGALFPETEDTSTLDALRNTVSKATDIVRWRTQKADLEKEVFTELSVQTLAEARDMLSEETAATLEGKFTSIDADIESAEFRLSQATAVRANAERDLDTLSGSAEIAYIVEQRATIQIEIEDALLNYVERDFGLRLAEEAIRRYRDKHRSGMMNATERSFSELTNGAYQKLITQPDGSSEILLVVDANGIPKQMADLSKGTRFQLYLALRAAAYEQMVSQGVQLPFFCDDVFETFDEDRTRAACRLMERIGRSGQAIYLTHHRHVVEIAKEVCTTQPLVHTI